MGEPNTLKRYYHDVGRTQGTETSKYLQEEKTTVIPQVVASERGTAQVDCNLLEERSGKFGHRT